MANTSDKNDHPTVMVKCRRGSDKITNGQTCDSRSAHSLNPQGSSVSIFKCVKCGFVWSVAVGGSFTGC